MRRWIVTFGGAGMCPAAPGTVGSLAATVMLGAAYAVLMSQPISVERMRLAWQGILLLSLLVSAGASVWLGPWAIAYYRKKDPAAFVLDEVAGICLSLLGLPLYKGVTETWPLLLAFVLFRVFDIVKPPPVRQLERLPGGWGILMDDLAAGVYANLLGQIVVRWIWPAI